MSERKYFRHALRLSRASTPDQYQENLKVTMLALFINGEEGEELMKLAPAWLEAHQQGEHEGTLEGLEGQ